MTIVGLAETIVGVCDNCWVAVTIAGGAVTIVWCAVFFAVACDNRKGRFDPCWGL